MHYKRITRIAPNGTIERPWRNRQHQFVLGDPAHGSVKHHDEFAVKVDNYGEALELVERGFSIRMSDGRSPPSLVSAGSLVLMDEPITALDDLWVYTTPVAPFTKEVVLKELKQTFWAQGRMIERIACPDAAHAFTGLDFDELEATEAEAIDLGRFAATRVVSVAYDYAFGSTPSRVMSDDDVDDLEVLLELASAASTNRFFSPMHFDSSAIRVTLEMAYARWQLRECSGLTVKRMAFLARMTETAVRNSLSKEGIKPENGLVPFKLALAWLEGRQNFLPQQDDERPWAYWTYSALHELRSRPLADAFDWMIAKLGSERNHDGIDVKELADEILSAVRSGQLPTVKQMRALARQLGLSVDRFTIEGLSVLERQLNAQH